MKKFRVFFGLAVLMLLAAGVFAKSSKFVAAGLVYSDNGVSFTQIDDASNFGGFTTTGTTQAQIRSSLGSHSLHNLYASDGTNPPVALFTNF